MNRKTFSRRSFVRGAGGITIGLPFLESLVPRTAQAQAAPKRFVIFNHPEGVIADEWQPAAGSDRTNFQLAPQMLPLAAYKGDLIITRGIDSQSCRDIGSTHKSSMDHILTGGHSASIDQVIAEKIGGGSRFRSLEFGVNVRSMGPGYRAVWAGGKPVPCVNDPKQMFARLFTGGTPVAGGSFMVDETAILQLAAKRKSVIDAVKVQFDGIKAELGADDRSRLEAHLGAIREAEKELLATSSGGGGGSALADCKNPMLEQPAVVDAATTTKLQMDMLVLALACRLTNVATLQWSQTGCSETFPFLPVKTTDVLHGWVHNDKGLPEFKEQWRRTMNWFATQMAYLLGRMKQINEGGKTLLDSSAVVMVSSFGHAGGHSSVNVPFVVAGSAGGALKTGQFLDFTKTPQPHNRLFLSLAKAYGIDMASYGSSKYGTSPLSEVFT